MSNAAAEPLIANNRSSSEAQDERDEALVIDESVLAIPGLFIWTLTFCAGVSGFLFGYDTGVISSTLISIGSELSSRPLTTMDKSLITSCTSFFALIASPLAGLLADSFGRKNVILGADILFIAGALWQAFTTTVWGMIGGRSVVGLAVGSASFVVPLYISELAPSSFRGRLVTVSALFITGGQVVAYLVGWWFSTQVSGWRWMVGLGALPAAVQFCLMQGLPETPRWLMKASRREEAKTVLLRVYGGKGTDEGDVKNLVNGVLRRVEKEIYDEDEAANGRAVPRAGKTGWSAKVARVSDSFSQLVTVGGNRRALVIACMLQGFQQLCGFNSLMYFSATIFTLVGFRSPTLTSLSIACTNFLFTLVAFHNIDRIGRRRILLWSVPIMVAGLALCAVAFNYVELPAQKAGVTQVEGGVGGIWPVIILGAMVVYVAGYAVGMGNVPWQQSELFPLAVRSLGSALSTATNWGSNTIIGISFLPMMETLTPVGTFALYAIVCCAAWFCIWMIYPETAGLSLEDVGGLLKDGWGVEKSVRNRNRGRRRDGGR
ncbi:general substrate transporter [Pleomassaria siparia CBS 279.74]|uniref:General substrate transporter n=1 Tax=Pleomassaria siparia CBS 279.74 TaxID=1314801 RepID=A0A6G1KDV5_9PLEO|nr:general substrate transporter [Pleomassaria siparia CBS 279.74]